MVCLKIGRACKSVQRLVDSGINVTTGGEVDAISPQNVDRDHEMANRAIEDALAESKREAAECGFIWSTGLDTFQMGPEGFVHRSAGRLLLESFGKIYWSTTNGSGRVRIGDAGYRRSFSPDSKWAR